MGQSQSRVSVDVRHHKHAGRDGVRQSSGMLAHAARHLTGEATQRRMREQNEHIDPGRTHLNQMVVNDGQGGFKVARSLKDAQAYREARHEQVFRKMNEKTWTDTTLVAHLPKGMCVEKTWTDTSGEEPLERTYLEPRDWDEMEAYFGQVVEHLGEYLGGKDSIHAVVLNMDETTPHIHVHCDTFVEDQKHPGRLKVGVQERWYNDDRRRMSDPSQARSGREKMQRFHASLRERLIGQGYPVERESSSRSTEHLDKKSFEELKEREKAVEARERDVEEEGRIAWRTKQQGQVLKDEALEDLEAVEAREQAVEARESAATAQEAMLRQVRRDLMVREEALQTREQRIKTSAQKVEQREQRIAQQEAELLRQEQEIQQRERLADQRQARLSLALPLMGESRVYAVGRMQKQGDMAGVSVFRSQQDEIRAVVKGEMTPEQVQAKRDEVRAKYAARKARSQAEQQQRSQQGPEMDF